MIEMEMSRDIKEYSPKIVGFLDKRQVVCVLVASTYGIPLFLMLKGLSITLKVTIVAVAMFPVLACGWAKAYGLPLEKFFFKCIMPMLMSPRKRLYKTNNIYGLEDKEIEKERLIMYRDIKPKKLKRKERKKKEELYRKCEARQ